MFPGRRDAGGVVLALVFGDVVFLKGFNESLGELGGNLGQEVAEVLEVPQDPLHVGCRVGGLGEVGDGAQ